MFSFWLFSFFRHSLLFHFVVFFYIFPSLLLRLISRTLHNQITNFFFFWIQEKNIIYSLLFLLLFFFYYSLLSSFSLYEQTNERRKKCVFLLYFVKWDVMSCNKIIAKYKILFQFLFCMFNVVFLLGLKIRKRNKWFFFSLFFSLLVFHLFSFIVVTCICTLRTHFK